MTIEGDRRPTGRETERDRTLVSARDRTPSIQATLPSSPPFQGRPAQRRRASTEMTEALAGLRDGNRGRHPGVCLQEEERSTARKPNQRPSRPTAERCREPTPLRPPAEADNRQLALRTLETTQSSSVRCRCDSQPLSRFTPWKTAPASAVTAGLATRRSVSQCRATEHSAFRSSQLEVRSLPPTSVPSTRSRPGRAAPSPRARSAAASRPSPACPTPRTCCGR